MSFRLFVYYCAVGGAWAGFIGWILGYLLAPRIPANNTDFFPYVLRMSVIGLFLGFAIAFGLSFLDAVFTVSLRQLGKVLIRVFVAVLVGVIGGLFASFIGAALYKWLGMDFVFLLSWTFVGLLVGMSISAFQLIASLISKKDIAGSMRKFVKCVIGGTIGGIMGGVVAWLIKYLAGQEAEAYRSPTALGFIAIGACIGLLVGLAQIILKEAWIKVEAGFRPGREMILAKERTSIGRAEGSDIALFGDNGVEKSHASIVLDAGRYYLEDLQAPGGSYVNDQKVVGRSALKTGDMIRVGKSVLRFSERAKRTD